MATVEQLFKESIIESSSSAIATCDLQGKMTYCNPAFLKQWGFDGPEEVHGKFFWKFWLVENRLEEIMAALQGAGAWSDEIKAIRKDGTLFDVQVSAATVSDTHGNPVGLTSTSIDITHRKQAQSALESQSAFLSAVLDNIQDAIVICNAQGRLVRFNEAARRLHGLTEQPVGSDRWAEYYDLYQIDGITPLSMEDIPLFRALKGEQVRNAEIVVAAKHSQPRALICSGQALTEETTGRITGAVVAMHDITERKEAEAALRNAEQRLRLILDTVPALIWQKDRNGIYKQVNKAFCHTHGRSEKEFLGKKDHDVFPPELADQYVAADRRVLSSGKPEIGIEEQLLKPLGELGWSRKDKLVYRDTDGNVAGTIGFAVDITATKRAEDALRQSEERFRLLSDVTLEGIVIHQNGIVKDLNFTLTKLLGYQRDDLVGKNILDLIIHEEDIGLVHQNILKDYAQPYIVRAVRKNGDIFFAEVEGRNFQLKDEMFRVVAVRNVTERVRAEKALAESEKKWRNILINTPQIGVTLTPQAVIVFANRHFLELTGWQAEEVIGRNWFDLCIPENVREGVRGVFQRTLSARYPL